MFRVAFTYILNVHQMNVVEIIVEYSRYNVFFVCSILLLLQSMSDRRCIITEFEVVSLYSGFSDCVPPNNKKEKRKKSIRSGLIQTPLISCVFSRSGA